MKTSMRTIIIDDEPACIKSLCSDLEDYPQVQVIDTATSAEKGKMIILKYQPDLLFLDVEMPKMNGLELLNEISSQIHSDMCVVFYSAFDKYMIEALRRSAFDFLLKPYKPKELELIIDRVAKRQHTDNSFEQSIRRLLAEDRKFALHTITGLLLLRRPEILHFQYLNEYRYWKLTLTNGSVHKLRLSTTAKEILQISNAFLQVSQDCIINMDYLTSIENKTYRCIFNDPYNDLEIYATRRYYSRIKEVLEII